MLLVKDRSYWLNKLIWVLVGAVFPLGFAPFEYWFFSALSAALLIFLILNMLDSYSNGINEKKNTSLRNALFSLCFYWSLGAYGVGASWVYVSIHNFGNAAVPLATLITGLFIVVLAIIKLSFAYLVYKLITYCGKSMLLLIIPFAWVISESLVSVVFNGFPWLLIGYSQLDGPLASLATWFGVYGVSWFELALLTGIVLILTDIIELQKIQKSIDPDSENRFSARLKKNILVMTIVASVPVLSHVLEPATLSYPGKENLDVALVQPNISQEKKWQRQYFFDIIKTLYAQTESHWDADLIVWPEGAIPAYHHQVTDIYVDLENRLRPFKTDLLTGLPVYNEQEKVSYVGFSAIGNTEQIYNKQVLVPFGEYVPLSQLLRGVIDFFNLPMSNFVPGDSDQPAIAFDDYDVIPAICYEVAYPHILQKLLRDADHKNIKPKLIVTVSNDAWFGDSLGPYQHMQMARMRALELGIPLIRSTNDGITAVVDAKGQQISELARHTQDTLRFQISLEGYNTIYRRYGYWWLGIILALSSLFFVLAAFNRFKTEAN